MKGEGVCGLVFLEVKVCLQLFFIALKAPVG